MPVKFQSVTPDPSTLIFPNAVVVGDVSLGKNCSVWYGAVIRGDEEKIIIGDNTNIQDNAVLHVTPGLPLRLGSGVTVGHGAILHSCTVGDDSLIGMGAIVLDGAVIGKNCLIAAGAVVTPRTVIPDGSMVMGSPGKVKRELTAEEMEGNRLNAKYYVDLKEGYR